MAGERYRKRRIAARLKPLFVRPVASSGTDALALRSALRRTLQRPAMELRFVSREQPEELVAIGVKHLLGDAVERVSIRALREVPGGILPQFTELTLEGAKRFLQGGGELEERRNRRVLRTFIPNFEKGEDRFEHFDLSRLIGGLGLVPKFRLARSDLPAVVRMQTARQFPVQFLETAVLGRSQGVPRHGAPGFAVLELLPEFFREFLGSTFLRLALRLIEIIVLRTLGTLCLRFDRVSATVEDRLIGARDGIVTAVIIFLLDFVDQILDLEQFRLQVANLGQERSEIRAEP